MANRQPKASRNPPAAETFLPLHPFDLRILLVLAEGPAHGYPIIKAIEERDGSWRRVLAANLYRRLRDLAESGLVEDVDPLPEAPDDDRKRRTFALTALGRRVAEKETHRLDALVRHAKSVLGEA